MMALLNWRVWATIGLALVLAASHVFIYRAGKAAVRADWTAEKLAESEGKRQREKAATAANQGVDRELQASNKRRAAAERATADSLRELQAALNRPNPDAGAPSGANGTGGLERELLGQCANSLAAMAITADRLEGKVVGLQNYARLVCLNSSAQ